MTHQSRVQVNEYIFRMQDFCFDFAELRVNCSLATSSHKPTYLILVPLVLLRCMFCSWTFTS